MDWCLSHKEMQKFGLFLNLDSYILHLETNFNTITTWNLEHSNVKSISKWEKKSPKMQKIGFILSVVILNVSVTTLPGDLNATSVKMRLVIPEVEQV